MKHILFSACLFISLTVSSLAQKKDGFPSPAKAVLQVDIPYPTFDKPQCKLWYQESSWWAILPRTSGPSLWQRTAEGWIEDKEVSAALAGIPGRADVQAKGKEVTAVGVDTHFLTVFRLARVHGKPSSWKTSVIAKLLPPSNTDKIETATIAQDGEGRWWVAAVAGGKACVWTCPKAGKEWSKPQILADKLPDDDICAISSVADGVAVIWSEQRTESVNMRLHRNGDSFDNWLETNVIQAGNKTADDHLHTSLSPDGTLWLATKNSVDEDGKAQQVLRVRSANGIWQNLPYAVLDSLRQPSRPVVFTTENPEIVLAGHTIYHRKSHYLGEIVFGQVDTTSANMLVNETTIITPDTSVWVGDNRINDITGSRKPYPLNVPWIILASDKDGRVYEADLRKLTIGNKLTK
jgi:hypothetical protein